MMGEWRGKKPSDYKFNGTVITVAGDLRASHDSRLFRDDSNASDDERVCEPRTSFR